MNTVDLVRFDYFVYAEKLKKNPCIFKIEPDVFKWRFFYLFICSYYDVN